MDDNQFTETRPKNTDLNFLRSRTLSGCLIHCPRWKNIRPFQ